jgi:hypothetical protein
LITGPQAIYPRCLEGAGKLDTEDLRFLDNRKTL